MKRRHEEAVIADQRRYGELAAAAGEDEVKGKARLSGARGAADQNGAISHQNRGAMDRLLRVMLRTAVVCAALLVPAAASAAQRSAQRPTQRAANRPDALTPSVVLVPEEYDTSRVLGRVIVETAQKRFPRTVSRRRLMLITTGDVSNTLTNEPPARWDDREYRQLAMLVRSVAAVVIGATGRADSLAVLATVHYRRWSHPDSLKQPSYAFEFQTRSADAAVDSVVAHLLADPLFRRRRQ